MRGVPDWVLVGMIKRIHGNQGELLIKPLTDREERFSEGSELYVTRKRESERVKMRIAASRTSDRGPLIMLEGYNSRVEAEPLFGASLFVPGEQITPLDEGSYYAFEIEGCLVYEGEQLIGTVTKLAESAKANPYIEVDPGEERPLLLIPFISQVVKKVDVEGQRIDIIEGFLG
ncbi:MAG: ribosome maturation factor RimM [Thermoleophilia bacterium]